MDRLEDGNLCSPLIICTLIIIYVLTERKYLDTSAGDGISLKLCNYDSA